MKYRKKPIAVEAIRFNGYVDPMFSERPLWLEQAIKDGTLYLRESIATRMIKVRDERKDITRGTLIMLRLFKDKKATAKKIYA